MKTIPESSPKTASPIWTRRAFLIATLGGAAGAFCGGGSGTDPASRWATFDQQLLAAVGEFHLSDELGEAYLYQIRLELNGPAMETLLTRLRLRLIPPTEVREKDFSKQELLQILAKAVHEDFAQGRICTVQNWYLSLTECQLAAIGYLDRENRSLDPIFSGFVPSTLCEVSDWGPPSTTEGTPFNLQPDGSSALWVKATGAPPDTRLYLGTKALRTTVTPKTVTADLVPGEAGGILDRVGVYSVYLVSDSLGKIQEVGQFEVRSDLGGDAIDLESLDEKEITKVSAWGPKQTKSGVGFNVQPQGESAFWVRVEVPVPNSATLVLGNVPLRTTIRPDSVTAALVSPEARALLDRPARLELYLVDPKGGFKQMIGEFQIVP